MYIYAHDKHHTAKMKIIARASSAVANLTARRAVRTVPFVCRSREWYKLVNIVRHLLKKRFEATRTVPAASVVYIFMTPYLFGCPIKQCARGADVRAMRIQIAAARVVIVWSHDRERQIWKIFSISSRSAAHKTRDDDPARGWLVESVYIIFSSIVRERMRQRLIGKRPFMGIDQSAESWHIYTRVMRAALYRFSGTQIA